MRVRFGKRILCAALAALSLAPAAYADDDPLNDPGVQKTLRAMAGASTWYHPDIFGMTDPTPSQQAAAVGSHQGQE